MKIAMMQPYIFSYIGYWQIIHSADSFVLSDEAQYIHYGCINDNRFLKQTDGLGVGSQYVIVPIEKHSIN
jgi:hypothetical protein